LTDNLFNLTELSADNIYCVSVTQVHHLLIGSCFSPLTTFHCFTKRVH